MIRIVVNGQEMLFEQPEISVGRSIPGQAVDLNLGHDSTVSRRHARLWLRDDELWIEDLGSRGGTFLDGDDLRATGGSRLCPGQVVRLGENELRLWGEETVAGSAPVHAPEVLAEITPLLLSDGRLEARLEAVLELLHARLPEVERAAVLLGRELRLAAQVPDDTGPSAGLAGRAMDSRRTILWPPPGEGEKPDPAFLTPQAYRVRARLYVPLPGREGALGCLCLENEGSGAAFGPGHVGLAESAARLLAVAVENECLRESLHRSEEVLENLQRLVPAQVAEKIRGHRGRLRLGGEYREVTILFADLRGFTMMSSTMRADDVIEMIEEYFGQLVPALTEHGGMIDKYVGDAIMAIFGSPEPDADHTEHAVSAALEMQRRVAVLNAARKARGEPAAELGIGIHAGEAVHGFTGTRERMEFTAIGDAVNRASRYCDGARGGEVLVSPEVYQRVWRGLKGRIEARKTSIPTKHEGELAAYRISVAGT